MHGSLGRAVLALKDGLAILVELDLGNNNVGGVDTNGDGGTVDLLAGDAVDVDNPLLTVDLDDLTLTALEGTTNDHNLIILADGNGAGL